mmetsp:Transcript_13284/g.20156  ORF Transcript_13284/g.20156 Transcript_13284/m.20156 type:complete len:108 (+) Transcript_13284:187-510(+)
MKSQLTMNMACNKELFDQLHTSSKLIQTGHSSSSSQECLRVALLPACGNASLSAATAPVLTSSLPLLLRCMTSIHSQRASQEIDAVQNFYDFMGHLHVLQLHETVGP